MPSCLGLSEGSHRQLSSTVALTFRVPQGLCISKKNTMVVQRPSKTIDKDLGTEVEVNQQANNLGEDISRSFGL